MLYKIHIERLGIRGFYVRRQSKLVAAVSTCCLETQTKASKEESLAEGLTRTGSSGIVLRAVPVVAELHVLLWVALCQAWKEGTGKTPLGSLGEWKTEVLYCLCPEERTKPFVLLFICVHLRERG